MGEIGKIRLITNNSLKVQVKKNQKRKKSLKEEVEEDQERWNQKSK